MKAALYQKLGLPACYDSTMLSVFSCSTANVSLSSNWGGPSPVDDNIDGQIVDRLQACLQGYTMSAAIAHT